MAKTAIVCPFSNKACTECALFRGRHHYLSISKQHRGFIDEQEKQGKSCASILSVDFLTLSKSVGSRAGKYGQTKSPPAIRLKVVDMESRTTRICSVDELKEWDWGNSRICRLIEGWQVTNFDSLVAILCHKAETGTEEVELYEAPRFMLLAGG